MKFKVELTAKDNHNSWFKLEVDSIKECIEILNKYKNDYFCYFSAPSSGRFGQFWYSTWTQIPSWVKKDVLPYALLMKERV